MIELLFHQPVPVRTQEDVLAHKYDVVERQKRFCEAVLNILATELENMEVELRMAVHEVHSILCIGRVWGYRGFIALGKSQCAIKMRCLQKMNVFPCARGDPMVHGDLGLNRL